MRIVPIFPERKPAIYAAQYDGEPVDELNKVFAQWSDVFWLQSFFKQHKHDLRYGYHGCTSVHKAVNQTTRDVRNMRRRLFELALQGQFDRQNTLQNMFVPLRNEMRLAVLQKSKAKIRDHGRSSWLRLYAIRVAPNLFVITGGAIKLTHRMEEREHTRVELEKLEKVKRYLADEWLFDEIDFELMEI
jgi:hypothetical protein